MDVFSKIRVLIFTFGIVVMLKKRKLKWYGHVSRYQDFPKQYCKTQYLEGEGEVDRDEYGKTT